MTSTEEPVPASVEAGAGSTSSEELIPPFRDVLRAVSCALLVAASVASPGTAPLLAPFVPAIVAIRLLRQRVGRRDFLIMATVATVIGALGAAVVTHAWAAAAAAALLLVPALGIVHARAARHDPIDAPKIVDWPEPRLTTGLTPTIIAWLVATLVVVTCAVPVLGAGTGEDLVRSAYSFYTDGCKDGGAFARNEAFCDETLAQRDRAVEIARDHAPELLAAFVAIMAFGGAGTAHLVVLARARRYSDRVRRSWRLRELELHWSAAYALAIGLVAWMLAGDGGSNLAVAVRSAGVLFGTLGALMVVSQGVGLVAWLFTRGGSPTWYRVVLCVFALFVLPVTLTLVFLVGVLDLALHPRRRALARAKR